MNHNPSAMGWAFAACLVALFVSDPVSGQESSLYDRSRSYPVPISRLSGEITLDGVIDEAAWGEIEPLPMTQYAPVFNAPMTERTEIRLAHDDEYLYMAGRLFDSEPDQIATKTLYRDQYSGDDLLAMVVDSYNDYETAVWFVTNPAGVRNDRTVSNDAEFAGGPGSAMNFDWNSHWDVVATQDDEGWYAEFRIPFSTLGFQAVDDEVTMGIIVYRSIGRKNERHTYPAIEPIWGFLGFAKPSQAQRISMRGVRQTKPVYVTPFWLGGMTQRPFLADPPEVPSQRWRTHDDPTREMGVDMRFSPTSNLSLDITANTDFAQVEADDQQVNLTRFPLFFPEKRQFFQERASTFQFGTGGFTDRLFHSRQIGLASGQIVRIYGGARAVGRLGGMDFGLLNMQTAAEAGRSGENMGVLRVNQEILNPYSSLGAMMTSRIGTNGDDNLAYGIDATVRPFGDEYIIAKWAQTFDELVDEGSALDAGTIFARWERRRQEGFTYSGQFRRVGADYTPRLGFQLRRDFMSWGGHAGYQHLMPDESSIRAVSAFVRTDNYLRLDDKTAESRTISPEAMIEFRNNSRLSFTLTSSYESLERDFGIADVTVPVGDYWFHEGRAFVDLGRSKAFRGMFFATAGSFYDGSRVGVSLSPTWTASKHFELEGGYELNRISFDDRDQATTTHLGRLKVATALDARVTFSAFAQYSNISDLTSLNLRFRYHFREGTDLWVVWNEGLNMERANGLDPRLPLSAGRSIMVKYSHALVW